MKLYLWWRSIDKVILYITCILILIGILLINVSTQSVALRIGVNYYNFINKQLFFLVSGSFLIIIISMLKQRIIKNFATIGLILFFCLLVFVNIAGVEIKGSRRWVNLAGISIQPSEFIKPFFAIVNAIILSGGTFVLPFFEKKFYEIKANHALIISITLYIIIAIFLLMQPDFGMFLVFSAIWFMQIFIAGISYYITGGFFCLVFLAFFFAYNFFSHVKYRVDLFLNPSASSSIESNYQVAKSMLAFKNGGLFGVGLGEGLVKRSLPDSHTDFIFAVAAEEFGSIFCIIILTLFFILILRVLSASIKDDNKFIIIAKSGLIAQIILQVFINIGVSLNLLPTKGMTLPLISYGGSSTLAICILFGFLLNLNKNIINHNYKFKFK